MDPRIVLHNQHGRELPRVIGGGERATGAGVAPGVPEHAPDSTLQLATFCQAEKLAAIGQMVACVVHELGNPLSIISSSLQYLHERLAAGNDPASDFTMTALTNVERMHELLRSMLDFARVKKPAFEPADLKALLSEVLRFVGPECARRGITIETSFEPELPRVSVDVGGIKQIILNLVKNGLDALAEGGTTLAVCTRLSSDGRSAIAEIANNGPAIPREVWPHLFRPFHTTKDGGTGLGLYLSKQIAKDHGGDLEAEGPLQGGVRFTLTLPLRNGADHGAHPDRRR